MITYWALRSGHILQPGEKLLIHGSHCQVAIHPGGYQLVTSLDDIDVFERLHIRERYGSVRIFLDKFCHTICWGSDIVVTTREGLTGAAIGLFEEPLFQIGEEVTISPRLDGIRYPVSYTDDMRNLEGETVHISRCENGSDIIEATSNHNGDIHLYHIEEGGYYWHSSMFIYSHFCDLLIPTAAGLDAVMAVEPDQGNIWTLASNSMIPKVALGSHTIDKMNAAIRRLADTSAGDTKVRLPKDEDSPTHIIL